MGFITGCWAATFAQSSSAPSAATAQPLEAMPYSPSLDLTSLDRSVDPCEDFYRFSCGGWQKNNPIPADQASWSVYSKLANDNQQFLWGILRDAAVAKQRTPVQQKIGDYFAACMDTTAIDALGFAPLKPGLSRIDALDTRAKLAAAIAVMHHELPGSFFFDSGTEQDAADSNMMIAAV
ncbi:MAG TPA: M13 family metallopeptidase N-terminal domain-containing protein, partial [Acidobacteriaceae bacterium]